MYKDAFGPTEDIRRPHNNLNTFKATDKPPLVIEKLDDHFSLFERLVNKIDQPAEQKISMFDELQFVFNQQKGSTTSKSRRQKNKDKQVIDCEK